jgi:hypothetical protein
MEKISRSRIFGGKKNRFKPEQDWNSCRKALDNGRGRQYNETIQTIWNSYKLFVIPYSSPSEKCPMLRSGCLQLRQSGSFLQSF